MFDKIKKYFERIRIDISIETKRYVDETVILEVGLQLYHDRTIRKLKPSFFGLANVLDGRIARNAISKALDIMEDRNYVIRNAGTGFQHGLTEDGINFFEPIYNKVILT